MGLPFFFLGDWYRRAGYWLCLLFFGGVPDGLRCENERWWRILKDFEGTLLPCFVSIPSTSIFRGLFIGFAYDTMLIGEKAAVAVLLCASGALAGPLPRRYPSSMRGAELMVFRRDKKC